MKNTALTSTISKLFLVVAIAASGLYIRAALHSYRAFKLSSQQDEKALQRAIELEPRNAFAYDVLCRYRANIRQQPAMALTACQRATGLNSHDASYWLDLAAVYYETGQKQGQREAIQKAVLGGSDNPWSGLECC